MVIPYRINEWDVVSSECRVPKNIFVPSIVIAFFTNANYPFSIFIFKTDWRFWIFEHERFDPSLFSFESF